MKPKFRRFTRKFRRIAFRGLPAIIVFSAFSFTSAEGAVVGTDGSGNYTVVAVEANTIQGNGGATNVITVPLGATLSGDVGALDGIQIISQGVGPVYTVSNAGIISVGAGQAVESLVLPVNVSNTGSMINTLGDLIVIGSGSTVTNVGSLSGENDVIVIGGNGTVNNSGAITGITGNGIIALDDLILANTGGAINGAVTGVSVTDSATITNSGTIAGAGEYGIAADDELALTNTGAITGDDDGVSADDGAIINNTGVISGTTDDGIDADDTLALTNSGTVGGADNGVEVDQDATVTNLAGGTIGGTTGDGILATLDLTVTNDGTIGGGDDGIDTGANALIDNNAGAVIGGTAGDGVASGAFLVLTNDGTIGGGTNGVGTGANATIDNGVGSVIGGSGGDGVLAGALLDLSNAGVIGGSVNGVEAGDSAIIDNLAGATIGGSGGDGVQAGASLDLSNAGIIGGSVNGIETGASAIIDNLAGGIISGGGGDGVQAGALLDLSNASTIAGTINGIEAGDTANIDNFVGAVISGSSGNGVLAGNALDLANDGTIAGGDDGVEALNSAVIVNSVTGVISGTDDGIDALDSLNLNNAGSITGGDEGVEAGNSATVLNQAGATITGTGGDGLDVGASLILTNNGTINGAGGDGVDAGDSASIINNSIITGGSGDGIEAGDFLNLTNNATITGNDDGVEAGESSVVTNNFGAVITGTNGDGVDFDGAIGSTLNNFGTINGADGAIDGSSGNDVFNLNDGSVINGDVFGWGGSDTINFSGGLTSPFGLFDTTENIIHGDVFDVETINKTGGGFAVIGDGGIDYDANTITDPLVTVEADVVNVLGGGLIINGNVTATDGVSAAIINVAGGAELDGTGTWTANVNLADTSIFSAGATAISLTSQTGPIAPTSAIGSLTINGTVTDAVAFRWDVAPQTPINNGVNSDLVTATTYVINDMNLHISPTSLDSTITNGTYTIIATDNPVDISGVEAVGVQFNSNIEDQGGFIGSEVFNNLNGLNENTVLGGFFATVSASLDGTDVLLTIEHDFEGLPGLTATQSAIGAIFDVESNNPDPAIQDILAALDYSSLEEVQAVLAALDPSTQLGMLASVVNSNYRINRTVQNHLFDLRICEQPMAIASTGSKDAKGSMAPQQSAVAPSHRYGFWGNLSYDWQDLEGSDEVEDFDGNVGSFTAGFDWRVNPTLAFGILLDGSRSDLDHDGGDTEIDSLRVAVYGTWGACTGWYSDFLLGYGKHDLDTDSETVLGSFDSSTDADSIQALWTVGYTFASGDLKHGPFGGFEYQRVDADAFEIEGDVPVSVDDYEIDSLRALIGYRVNTTYGKFRPYASIAYAHEFGDDENSTSASLGGVFEGAAFDVEGLGLSSAILLTAGTGYSINESLTLDVGYRGEISVGDDGVDSHGGSIGLNWTF
jgi:outer membrane autotransporter protein